MSQCTHCKQSVTQPRKVDIPEGAMLCDDCYEEFVWECDSCGSKIALPDVEGGETEALTPLAFEHLCQDCCDATVSECVMCGVDELTEVMTETEEGLLCERCSRRDPSEEHDSQILTKENWKNAITQAVNTLPEEIQESIGFTSISENTVVLTIAGNPIDDGESSISRVEITYWNSMREEGWPPEFDEIYGPGGIKEEQAEWPVVSVEGDAPRICHGLYPGRAKVSSLVGEIQKAILEEFWGGGGGSYLISKDRKGRFINSKNGNLILDWQ